MANISLSSVVSTTISNREHYSHIVQDIIRCCWNSETLTTSEKGKLILRVMIVAGDALYDIQNSSYSSHSKGTQVISCIASVASLSGEIILKKIEGQDLLRDPGIHMKGAQVLKATGKLFKYPALTLAGQIVTVAVLTPPALKIIRQAPDYIREASDYIEPYIARGCMAIIDAGVSITERIERIREQWNGMGPLTKEIRKRKFSPIPEEYHTNAVFKKYICRGSGEPIRCPVCSCDQPTILFEKRFIMNWLTKHEPHPFITQSLKLSDLRLKVTVFNEIEAEVTRLKIPT